MTAPAAPTAPAHVAVASPGTPVRRPRWWPELLVIVWLCWVYDAVTNLAPLRLQAAYAHARTLLAVERTLHLDPEATLNHWLAGHPGLALWVSDYYDNAHFVVTLGVVGWLWWRHPGQYRPLRTSLVLINVIGLVVFWRDPTGVAPAPRPPPVRRRGGRHPRLRVVALRDPRHRGQSAGCHAVVAHGLGGLVGAGGVAGIPGSRAAGLVWAYPLITAVAVMATGNHFLLDVAAGVLTTALATWIAVGWQAWWAAAALPGASRLRRRRYDQVSAHRRTFREGSTTQCEPLK